jgi:hypothetical protein
MTVKDLSEFVVVVDPMELVWLAQAACEAERRAMRHDLDGQRPDAIREYSRASTTIRSVAEAYPEDHADAKVLDEHADQLLSRAAYLQRLGVSSPAVPIEEHIGNVRLSLDTPDLFGCAALSAKEDAHQANDAKVAGAAAAISGAAALLLLGPAAGAVLGVATALATTQKGQTGATARKVGHAGVRWLATADQLNREYRVSDSAVSVGRGVVKNTHQHAKSLLGQLGKGQKQFSHIGRRLFLLSSPMI